MSHLVHIADRVLNRPLMILPDKLALIASILEGRIGIDATELREIAAASPEASRFSGSALGGDGRAKAYRVDNGVAIIPVIGSLVNRGAWLGSKSGMTSYEGLAFQLSQAAADPDVKAIALDIDSPGGEAVGAFEMADRVRAVGKSKPVTAIVNGMAASAAYAIASGANQIVASPSGVAGSIGVVLMHADYSVATANKGIKPTLIFAGAHKVDGHPYAPLSADVKADLQAEVDNFYTLFVSSVAQGRKGRMTEKAARATEARTYVGQAAVDVGLVDAIGSFEGVISELAAKSGRRSPVAPKQSSSGLVLEDTKPPAVAVRPAVDCALIIEAGRKVGLDKAAAILADQSPSAISTEAAIDFLHVAAAEEQAKQAQTELHASGLYLDTKHLAVFGGPLFGGGDSRSERDQSDFGWSRTVDALNRKNGKH